MNILMTYFQSLISSIAPFFILLGILIFVHELGHFLVAKFFGVRVEVFSMGFGKKIFSYKRGDTTYCISLIPLGGYVKMFGDDPTADIPAEQRQHSFLHKPILQRFAIVLAGPLMNLFFAIFIYTLIAGMGEEVAGPYAGDLSPTSKAYSAGFRSGDKIAQINGIDTPTWLEVQRKIESSGGKVVSVRVERKGESQPLQFDVPVVFGNNENIFSFNQNVGQIPGLTQDSRWTIFGINNPESPAAKAGIPSLRLLVTINGKKVQYWRDLQDTFKEVLKPDATSVTLQVREADKPEKADSLQTFEIPLPKNWQNAPDLAAALGLESAELYIYQVKKDSPADKAGILPSDKVVRVGGQEMSSWADVLSRVKGFDPASGGMDFVIRRNGEEKALKVTPELTTLMSNKGQEERRYTVGIVSGYSPVGPEPVSYRLTNPLAAFRHGLTETAYMTEFIVMGIVRTVQGEVSAKNIGGVITIGRVASHSFAMGYNYFLRMMGLISINLFLINLLPVPVLDGGHLLFYTIEGLKGAPLSMRKMEIAQQVGLMLLMFLMAFALFNDFSNLFFSGW